MASTGSKQLQLSTSIQASFGNPEDPDYVFEIVANGDRSVMAVSLSTNAIKLYSPATGAFLGDCLGHTSTVSGISFPDPNSPALLVSSSADGTIRTWDIRQRKESLVFRHPNAGSEIWSFDCSKVNHLIAGGGEAQVLLWDSRNSKLAANMDEWHTEAVTQVHFHPTRTEELVTASVDGLINIANTNESLSSDEGLSTTMSVGTSIAKIGFYGSSNQLLWCLTHIETLSIWNMDDQNEAATFTDTRSKASYNWNLPSVNYLIDCHSPAGTENLWLAAGNNDGSVGYFPVSFTKSSHPDVPTQGAFGEVGAVLEGGHQGVVRSIWLSQNMESEQQLFGWTGGEDGRLCSWSQSGSSERSCAWVSSNLVMKKGSSSKQRHSPY